MSSLFPSRPESNPTIYAYKLLGVEGKEDFLKVEYDFSFCDTVIRTLSFSSVAVNLQHGKTLSQYVNGFIKNYPVLH